MEKLPATSYVRLVDMWLIFGQLLPFIQVVFTLTLPCIDLNMQHMLLQVILTTISELYNEAEGDDTINHHGFSREIQRGSNGSEKKVMFVLSKQKNTPFFMLYILVYSLH